LVTNPVGTVVLVPEVLLESKVCLKTGAKAVFVQMPWAKDFMLNITHAANNRYVYLLFFMRGYWIFCKNLTKNRA
jgi:hypothetical protein